MTSISQITINYERCDLFMVINVPINNLRWQPSFKPMLITMSVKGRVSIDNSYEEAH